MSSPHPRSRSSWPRTVDLGRDTWTLSAGWNARPDDLPRCAERLLASLTGISPLDPALAHWFRYEDPVTLDPTALTELLERGRDRRDTSGTSGSTVVLWNRTDDDLTVTRIVLSCGATANNLPHGHTPHGHPSNSIEIELPRPAGAPGLYRAGSMLDLVRVVVSAWQPRWCYVRPRSLRMATGSADILASWITYLDRESYTRAGDLPAGVRAVDGPDGAGEVFLLAPTPAELTVDVVEETRRRIALAAG